ncbi:MAG: lipid-A-disaccharide synthase [Candidatus Azotimanducaceae bacterium]|jgi:lipid-A-disaccharide synthase
MAKAPVIAMLAGEASGDILGASLINGLKNIDPHVTCIGIGGPQMAEEGFASWIDLNQLSVNGFVDPFLRLPSLLKILIQTRNRIVEAKPACFVGIDFNFFNLLLAGMLKKRGIRTVHYVSPTVWAWRQGRVKSIAKKIDLMLTLYPFEVDVYHQAGMKAQFVGHPKADEIGLSEGLTGKAAARGRFGFAEDDRVIALLPGSRGSEVKFSGPDFIGAATELTRLNRKTRFIVPAANEKRRQQVEELVIAQNGSINVKVILGQSKLAMQSADVVLVNSGTATLEAMLLKKPMVMSYRLGAMTYALVSRMVKTPYFALPNILANKPLVEEYIQDAAKPETLAFAVNRLVDQDHTGLMAEYDQIHQTLRRDAGAEAAQAILNLIGLTEGNHVST